MSQSALSFSDGGTALLRDPRQVPVKFRRVWERAQSAMGSIAYDIKNRIADEDEQNKEFTKTGMEHPELVERVRDAAILALVSNWSYGEVTQEVIENLPADTYDTLAAKCDELSKQMAPNFEVQRDPKADSLSGTLTTPASDDSASVGTPIPSVQSITTL